MSKQDMRKRALELYTDRPSLPELAQEDLLIAELKDLETGEFVAKLIEDVISLLPVALSLRMDRLLALLMTKFRSPVLNRPHPFFAIGGSRPARLCEPGDIGAELYIKDAMMCILAICPDEDVVHYARLGYLTGENQLSKVRYPGNPGDDRNEVGRYGGIIMRLFVDEKEELFLRLLDILGFNKTASFISAELSSESATVTNLLGSLSALNTRIFTFLLASLDHALTISITWDEIPEGLIERLASVVRAHGKEINFHALEAILLAILLAEISAGRPVGAGLISLCLTCCSHSGPMQVREPGVHFTAYSINWAPVSDAGPWTLVRSDLTTQALRSSFYWNQLGEGMNSAAYLVNLPPPGRENLIRKDRRQTPAARAARIVSLIPPEMQHEVAKKMAGEATTRGIPTRQIQLASQVTALIDRVPAYNPEVADHMARLMEEGNEISLVALISSGVVRRLDLIELTSMTGWSLLAWACYQRLPVLARALLDRYHELFSNATHQIGVEDPFLMGAMQSLHPRRRPRSLALDLLACLCLVDDLSVIQYASEVQLGKDLVTRAEASFGTLPFLLVVFAMGLDRVFGALLNTRVYSSLIGLIGTSGYEPDWWYLLSNVREGQNTHILAYLTSFVDADDHRKDLRKYLYTRKIVLSYLISPGSLNMRGVVEAMVKYPTLFSFSVMAAILSPRVVLGMIDPLTIGHTNREASIPFPLVATSVLCRLFDKGWVGMLSMKMNLSSGDGRFASVTMGPMDENHVPNRREWAEYPRFSGLVSTLLRDILAEPLAEPLPLEATTAAETFLAIRQQLIQVGQVPQEGAAEVF